MAYRDDLMSALKAAVPGLARLSALIVAVVLVAGCSGATDGQSQANGAEGERKVYIDPDTGEIVPRPDKSDSKRPRAERNASDTSPDEAVVPGPNGSQMIIHEPGNRPYLEAERSADGSVEIHHGETDQK